MPLQKQPIKFLNLLPAASLNSSSTYGWSCRRVILWSSSCLRSDRVCVCGLFDESLAVSAFSLSVCQWRNWAFSIPSLTWEAVNLVLPVMLKLLPYIDRDWDNRWSLRKGASRMIHGSRTARQRFTLREAAGTFIDSMFDALKDPSRVTDEERARRLAICGACDFLENGRCSLCRCPVSFKARLETWHCDLGKWWSLTAAIPSNGRSGFRGLWVCGFYWVSY